MKTINYMKVKIKIEDEQGRVIHTRWENAEVEMYNHHNMYIFDVPRFVFSMTKEALNKLL